MMHGSRAAGSWRARPGGRQTRSQSPRLTQEGGLLSMFAPHLNANRNPPSNSGAMCALYSMSDSGTQHRKVGLGCA